MSHRTLSGQVWDLDMHIQGPTCKIQAQQTHPAHWARVHKRSLGCNLLVGGLSFLLIGCLLGSLLLGLNLLLPASHGLPSQTTTIKLDSHN